MLIRVASIHGELSLRSKAVWGKLAVAGLRGPSVAHILKPFFIAPSGLIMQALSAGVSVGA